MGDVTRILSAIEQGQTHAADALLPLVYEELRRLAQKKMAGESPGQTISATALVHDAYLRLVTPEHQQRWESRGHFYASAAEAMRRILVERARQKETRKRGGGLARIEFEEGLLPTRDRSQDLLALDEALDELERHDEEAAKLVKLRYFAGLSHQQAAQSMGISRRSADRLWALARAWLFQQLREE